MLVTRLNEAYKFYEINPHLLLGCVNIDIHQNQVYYPVGLHIQGLFLGVSVHSNKHSTRKYRYCHCDNFLFKCLPNKQDVV